MSLQLTSIIALIVMIAGFIGLKVISSKQQTLPNANLYAILDLAVVLLCAVTMVGNEVPRDPVVDGEEGMPLMAAGIGAALTSAQVRKTLLNDDTEKMKRPISARVREASHGVVCSLPNEPFGYFGWPSIARQPDGTLCVVASGLRRGHVCPWGRTIICTSRDDGRTWTLPKVINNTPMDDRDAGIVSLGGRRLAVTWFTSNTYELFLNGTMGPQRNEDGSWMDEAVGRVIDSWTPEMIAEESGSWIRVSEDGEYWGEPRKAPVNAPHGFIVLKDGSWLYFGKEWQFTGEGKRLYMVSDTPICAARSTDEGRTWEMLGKVPMPAGLSSEHCVEPHVLELGPGELLGAARVQNPLTVMLTRSHDGGKTWSTLEDVGCVGSPPHLLRHSSGAIVCVYGYRSEGYGQRCMISRDEGKTWQTDIIIRDDGPNADLGYPASVELPDGSIFTIYYQYLRGQDKASILWSRWKLPGAEDGKFHYEDIVSNDAEIHRRCYFEDCECRLIFAPGYDMKSGKVAMTFSGRGNTPTDANIDAESADDFRRKFLADGNMILVPFCGGNTWGNEEATTRALKVLEHLSAEAGIVIPKRIPVFGFSMGGLTSLMFAVRHPERVSKVADIFGGIDLNDMAKRHAAYREVINNLYPDEAAKTAGSPLSHGRELAKFPVKIYHGATDGIVPPDCSVRLEKTLKDNGGNVELVIVPGIGHDNAILREIGDDLIEFLEN